MHRFEQPVLGGDEAGLNAFEIQEHPPDPDVRRSRDLFPGFRRFDVEAQIAGQGLSGQKIGIPRVDPKPGL